MTMPKKPPVHATGTITLTTPQPITKDTPLDWTWTIDGLSGREYPMVTWTIDGLSGREYPMVIVDVQSAEGDILYRRLDHPDVRPWVISDGSCPWTDPANPHYGQDGTATVQLWVYGSNSRTAPEYEVASTSTFPVLW